MRPSYTRTSAPATVALTYAQAAEHLRVDSAADQAYIEALIGVATEYVEGITGRVTVPTEFALEAPDWQSIIHPGTTSYVRLMRSPLVSVEWVEYFAPGASEPTTLDAENYRVNTGSLPGVIQFLGSLPALDERADAVRITFTAGYAEGEAPAMLVHAIRFLVSHLYEARSPVNIGNIVNSIPLTIEAMIQNQRISGFFG